MLKKTITYTDYDGNERTEDFYFNFSKAELMEMEMSTAGGMESMLRRIVAEQNTPRIVEYFKEIILKAYGKKSPDGRRFIKSKELRDEFAQTEAYSQLFMELLDPDKAAQFVNAVIPQSYGDKASSNKPLPRDEVALG